MADLGLSQLPRLNGTNYISWKYRILATLNSKDLGDILSQNQPAEAEKVAAWKRLDSQACSILTCAMDDTQVALILTCETAKEIWDCLKDRYENDVERQAIEARNNVSRLQMKKEETWQEYLLRAEKMLENARMLGAKIDEEEFILALLKGLPQRYNMIAMQFDNVDKPKISEVRRVFQRYEERNNGINVEKEHIKSEMPRTKGKE